MYLEKNMISEESSVFVDAVNFLEQVKEEETAFRQLKHCHLAVITKMDLVGEKQIEKVEEKIREINPVCEMKTSANGQIDEFFFKERSADL